MSNNTDNDSKKRKAKAYIIVFIVSFVIWFIRKQARRLPPL